VTSILPLPYKGLSDCLFAAKQSHSLIPLFWRQFLVEKIKPTQPNTQERETSLGCRRQTPAMRCITLTVLHTQVDDAECDQLTIDGRRSPVNNT